MSFWAGTKLVAAREITERIRQRSFLISAGVTLLIVAVAGVLPALIGGGGPTTYKVGTVGSEQRAVAAAAGAAGSDLKVKIEVKPSADRAKVARAVKAGDLDAALVGGSVLFDDGLPDKLEQALQVGSRQVSTATELRRQGLSRSQTRQAIDPPPLRTTALSGSKQGKDQKRVIALAAAIVLYGQLLTYGLWVATGVVEEKASRVVEILLSTLSPRSLMAGKIIGLGVLGMGQMLLTVVVGLGLALATGSLDATGADIAPVLLVLLVLLWFPLGFALYAALYAAAGALVSRQEDLQSSTTPLTVLILVSFFISLSSNNDPGSTLAKVASIVPFSAPLVMPGRMALGDASAGEVALALVLMLATTALLVRVGARIYAAGLLRTGKPLKALEAFRASRA